jgi:hypothetical protein
MPEQVHDSKQRTRILPARLRATAGPLRAMGLILAIASVGFAGDANAQQAQGDRHFYMIEKHDTAPGTTQPDATTVPYEIGLLAAGLAMLAHLSRSTAPKRTRKRLIAMV